MMMTWYDDVIVRTIVELPSEQVEHLDAHCRRQRISRAEGIRRAVSMMLADTASTEVTRAFGLWRGRNNDALARLESLRDEWR